MTRRAKDVLLHRPLADLHSRATEATLVAVRVRSLEHPAGSPDATLAHPADVVGTAKPAGVVRDVSTLAGAARRLHFFIDGKHTTLS